MRDTVLAVAFVAIALGAVLLVKLRSGAEPDVEPDPGGLDYTGGKLDPGTNLTVLRLAGTPREKGRAHGRLLRDEIRMWVDRLRPDDRGVADFVLETCGARLRPFLRPDVLEELEGVAAGAGISVEEALYLNTRFDLAAFGLVGGGGAIGEGAIAATFEQPAAVGPGPEVERWFARGEVQASDLVIIVHEDRDPCLVLVTLPGMVGAFCGLRGAIGGALRPVPTKTEPHLNGLVWPLVMRRLLDLPPSVGSELSAKVTRAMSMPLILPGGAGTLNVSPAGATWVPAPNGFAVTMDAPAPAGMSMRRVISTAQRNFVAEERARRLLTSDAPAGVLAVILRGGERGVQVTLQDGARRVREVVRYRQ